MVMGHPATLWQYLASFILYTLFAIGLIYLAYWYLRKNGGGLVPMGRKNGNGPLKLEVESTLVLEARKNLYVVRSGNERFLIATSMEGTQFLSRLDTTAGAEAPVAVADKPASGELP